MSGEGTGPENPGFQERRAMIGYARVSTSEQSVDLQVDALHAAGCEKLFVETVSGVSTRRPQLRAALAAAHAGDVLVVWRLDRLGRSLLHVIETINQLDAIGVGFRSLSESIDTTTSTGRLVLHIFGAIAEFERSMILERTHAGLAAARARGRVGGRPRKLQNGDVDRARLLIANADLSAADIAQQLNVSLSTFYAYFPGLRRSKAKAAAKEPSPPPYP